MKVTVTDTTGTRIRAAREAAGLTQADLSALNTITETAIQVFWRETEDLLALLPPSPCRARIEQARADMTRAPADRAAAIWAALCMLEPELKLPAPKDADALICAAVPPAWRTRGRYELARLVLGETPESVTGLPRQDAHEYLSSKYYSPGSYLLASVEEYTGAFIGISEVQFWLAIWIRDRCRDPQQREALVRDRREVVAGQIIAGRYIDRVDELMPEDLTTSVVETFRRAGERLQRQLERSLQSRGEPLCPEPRWWKPARCARLLRTGRDLVAEGRALRHCVGSYADAVRLGRSVIIGLCVLGQRSTVELDPETLEVRQHRGCDNAPPPALCERALGTLLHRWHAAHVGRLRSPDRR